MRMNAKPVCLLLAVGLMSCTGEVAAPAAGEATEGAAVAAPATRTEAAPEAAVQPAVAVAPPQGPAEAVEKLPCPPGPGTMCIGPLVVRAEGVNLLGDGQPKDNGSRKLRSHGNLVFENRTDTPVRVAILRAPVEALFDNGIFVSTYRRGGVAGVFVCRNEPVPCFQGAPGSFQALVPGDSPARANFSMTGGMDGSLAASLPSVSSATITLQVYVVGVDNVGSVLNISLAGVPVRNQLKS